MEKIIETSYTIFYQYKPDIVFSEMKFRKTISIADVKENMKAFQSFVPKGQKILYVSDIAKMRGMDREARDFAEKNTDFPAMITANAMLVSNPISRMVGNFLLGLNKAIIPMKLFTDIDKAVIWLRTFKEEEKNT
ncbi:MAG: hypothetical protein MK212_04410 [Saprospiraceae bacterium]|nr:hypothetical protein [Saprospiraceae bacterium]